MGVLDQITQMKEKGMSEEDIIADLQQKGVSPKAINEALNQSQIKKAVSGEKNEEDIDPAIRGEVPPQPPETPKTYSPEVKEMGEEPGPGQTYSPQLPPEQEYYRAEEEYPQEEYPEYGEYGAYGEYDEAGVSTDTFIEIAEQVFAEKTRDIQKQLEDLGEFKSLANVKLDHSLERIKRIEASMDKLQLAILDKIGSYGQTLGSIKKEMSMMQDSFGKMIPKVAERATKRHLKPKTTHKTTAKRKTVSKKR